VLRSGVLAFGKAGLRVRLASGQAGRVRDLFEVLGDVQQLRHIAIEELGSQFDLDARLGDLVRVRVRARVRVRVVLGLGLGLGLEELDARLDDLERLFIRDRRGGEQRK